MKTNLIIDKFTLSRESLCSLVCKTINDSIVYQAKSFEEANQIIEQSGQIDFLIYNLTFLESACNNQIRHLKKSNPNSKLLVITHSKDEKHIKGLTENGADATLSINATRDEICSQIRFLEADQSLVNYKQVQSDVRLANAVSQTKNNDGYNFKLTNRQKEVLDYVTKGYANKLIAYELGVSEGTVKLHVSSILRALKVTNRTEAAMRAGQFYHSAAH